MKKRFISKLAIKLDEKWGKNVAHFALTTMSKSILASCFFLILAGNVQAQFEDPCTIDPDDYTNYVLSGDFTGEEGLDDVVMINKNQAFGGVYFTVDMLTNVSGTQELIRDISVTPSLGIYNLDDIDGRMVGGDFDNDGRQDDFMLLTKTGTSIMDFNLYQSNGNTSLERSLFYTQTGYHAEKITGRVVSGDFDGDGYWDDIAAFYDYGEGETRIHVWLSDGSTMHYQSSFGWWNSTGYTAGKITDRVVSGDFDKDGAIDDIAAFYDYGDGETRIHVWLGQGGSFSYQSSVGWYIANQYSAHKISGRVVSVNIMNDEKYYDDIVAYYDYGNGITKMHIFESTGSSFDFHGSNSSWIGNIYNANMITDKIVAVKSDPDSRIADVLAIYDYGPTTDLYHLWKGYFSGIQNFSIDYSHHKFCLGKKNSSSEMQEENDIDLRKVRNSQIKQFPNPAYDRFYYELGDQIVTEIWITNIQGQIVAKQVVTGKSGIIQGLNLKQGSYICVYKNNAEIVDRKIITIVK